MRVRGARKAFLLGGLLLAVLVTIPSASAVPRPALAGTVRSAVGSLLDDVEVLVLRERGPDPVAVVRTDGAGRFLVPDLPIGIYRVVAVKDGYATWLGRVSLALRTTLDLVLQPAVVDPTMDPDWVLRVPDRGLLRETEAIAALDPHESGDVGGKGGPTIARLEQDRYVQGKVDHVFAFGADAVAGDRTHTDGGETRLLLTSHPGQRARVRFEGRREALDSSFRRESSDLHLDASYDTSLEGKLAMRAFYGTRETIDPAVRRAWGYDASWSRQLGPEARLHVGMAYLDAGVDPTVAEGTVPLAGRALGACGIYESRLGDRHQVRLGLRTRSAELSVLSLLSASALGGPEGISLAGVPDPLGWGLRLDAEDAVSVSAPLTLVYAIGYEDDLSGSAPSLFVQRAGAVWSGSDLRVDVRLTRHALLDTGRASYRPLEDPVGWSTSLEVPLAGGLRLRGETLSSPVQDDGLDRSVDGLLLERPVYLSDGLASTRQSRLTLQHQARRTQSFVQVARGTAEGQLAAVRPADLSVGGLHERHLDFVTGRFGVRVVPTGTEVAAEYRRVLADAPAAEYVELRIAQDLVRLESRGAAWRLLLAARATQDGTDVADGSGDGTQHWMGAGISLAF